MNALATRFARVSKRDERGFSLIDVVVTVAIIVALSVGGFIAYAGLVDSAKQGAVDFAASNVYKSAIVYESDTAADTNACSAVDEYNGNSSEIKVSLMVPKAGVANPSNPDTDFNIYYGKDAPAGTNTYNCL